MSVDCKSCSSLCSRMPSVVGAEKQRERYLDVYCVIEEPVITNIMEEREQGLPSELRLPDREDQLKLMKTSVFVSKRGQRLMRCFICVGKALTLSPDDPNARKYCHCYATPWEITRHFTNSHLEPLLKTPKARIKRNICTDTTLKDIRHFQNHVELVHGIKTPAVVLDE